MLDPFTNPASRTFWLGWLVSGGVAALLIAAGRATWYRPRLWDSSCWLDVQLLLGRQLLSFLGLLPGVLSGWWIATRLVRTLDQYGQPELIGSPLLLAVLYTAVLFVVWDLSRYVVHRLMHEVPALWAFHQVHHSAEHLTPLTFFRLHPMESLLYQLRGGLVTGLTAGVFFWLFRGRAVEFTVVGVHAVGFVFNLVMGNLRHSHTWVSFGSLERWLISPAQHQLHHALDGGRNNYGTWLAVWDRMFGTLEIATQPPDAFGLRAHERNHGEGLLSAWFAPFGTVFKPLLPVGVMALSLHAHGQDEEPEDRNEDETIFVYAPDGTPRVASAAHVVTEEELEQFEYDDFGKVVTQVPGVYIRQEDGYGLRPNIGMRGSNSDRSAKITLLEDGVPIAPAPYAAPAAYYFPMSTRLTGVEVFKGAAATQHGPQTVGGAVNVLTRRVPRETTGAVDLAYGMRETAKIHAWTGVGGDRGGILIEGAHVGSSGFKEIDGGGDTGFKRSEVMAKLRTQTDPALTNRHSLELKLGWANEGSNETYLGLHIDDFEANPNRRYAASALGRMDWNRTQAELTWQADPTPNVQIRTTAYHHWLGRSWRKFNRFGGGTSVHDLLQQPAGGQAGVFLAILRGEEDSATAEQTLWIGTNRRRFHSAGVQSRLRWRLKSDRVDNQLEAGIRLHGDRVARLHDEDPYWMVSGKLNRQQGDRLINNDSIATAFAIAAHVHDDLQVGPFHILPGIRSETVRTALVNKLDPDAPLDASLRTTLLPGLSGLVELGDRLHVFAGAHRGFSPVSPGQPVEVRSETSWSYEAGMRLGDATSRLEVVGYANDYINLTGQCTISGGCVGEQLDQQFNGGKVWVYGVESSAVHEILLPSKLSIPLSGSYTLTQSRFRTGFVSGFPQFGTVNVGDRLPYLPEHQGAARVTLQHPRFSVGAGLTARSGMRDRASQGALDATSVPSQVLLDLAAHAEITRDLGAYATVVNATNASLVESWRPFGARPTAPLQAMVGVKIKGSRR